MKIFRIFIFTFILGAGSLIAMEKKDFPTPSEWLQFRTKGFGNNVRLKNIFENKLNGNLEKIVKKYGSEVFCGYKKFSKLLDETWKKSFEDTEREWKE